MMNAALIFKVGKEGCPGRSHGWCHVIGDDPCNDAESCPFVYWFGIIAKINKMERQAQENNGRDA